MKSIRYLTLLSLVVVTSARAQLKFDVLEINNVRAGFNSNGLLFNDQTVNLSYKPVFEVPKDSGINVIYTGGLWFGAETPSAKIITAISYFDNDPGFAAGPVANSFLSPYAQRYDRVWKIDKFAIENHKISYQSPGYVMPEVIKNWPAHGDVNNGEAEMLAPFVDLNHNDQYEPELGEYPCIRGDQAVFMMFHDINQSDVSFRKEGNIEVHLMAYEFASEEKHVNNSVFLHYEVYNRSSANLSNAYLGIYTDGEVGCPDDDYVGCDSTLNTYFYYNGSQEDTTCPILTPDYKGYGRNPPAVGVVMLSHPMSSFLYFDRGTAVNGDPYVPADYYNYLTARWKDSSHITYAGSGYKTGYPTNYMFPGLPTDTTQWSDAKVNRPFDRRGVGSAGPFTIDAGDFVEFDAAVVFGRPDEPKGLYDPILVVKSAAAYLRDLYNFKPHECYIATGISENSSENKVEIFPNPTNGIIFIKNEDKNPSGCLLTNVLGEKIILSQAVVNQLDVSALPKGTYFLTLNWETYTTNHRIIIQ